MDFKELAYEAQKTPNVVEATNKPGLSQQLEDIQSRWVDLQSQELVRNCHEPCLSCASRLSSCTVHSLHSQATAFLIFLEPYL